MEATLRIKTSGGAEVQALVDRLDGVMARSRSRRARGAKEGAQQEAAHYRDSGRRIVADADKSDRLVTKNRLRQLAIGDEARRKSETLYAIMVNRATRALEAEVGKRGELTDKERRQVQDLARAMVVTHEQAERRRTAATRAEERKRAAERRQSNREAMGVLSGGAGAARSAASAFADYGDDVREKRRVREGVEVSATRIAASDIGDAGAARDLSSATQRVAAETGLDPQGVIDAMGAAQANFSALANTAEEPNKRLQYLSNVFPVLARAAASSGTSLTDMVNAAGEFQRQLGITNEQLPTAIAQAIQAGRLGSISFGDQARHMGAIGGAAARFLSNRPEDSMQSLATTNALFQFAGRAGGGGDVSATRANAFLTNFTSARGQRGLHAALGRDVMGADGQIVTNQGESQSEAFRRTIEDVYRRTGGNSTRFLDAAAGNNVRSRALGDQLFRDLRAHGGHLTEFGALVAQQRTGTVENSINAPFQAVHDTAANERSRRENRELYGLTGASTNWAAETERQLAETRAAHPFLGRLLGNDPASRVALDVTNMAYAGNSIPQEAPGAPRPRTRAELQMAIARDSAEASLQHDLGPMTMDRGMHEGIVTQRTAENLARLQLRDQAIAHGQSPTTISDESIQRLATTLAAAMRSPPSPHDAVHRETLRAGGGSPP